MPELPEVQTVVNDLQKITGDTIAGFWTDWKRALGSVSPSTIEKKIKGKKIVAVRRLSKFIILDLSSKESLLLHLRMTGKLIVNDQQNTSKHLHHILYLKKHEALEFHDIRKFGTIKLIPTPEVVLKNFNLGAEPLAHDFTVSRLSSILSQRKNKLSAIGGPATTNAGHPNTEPGYQNNRPIKNILLDQTLISGIGNIYASEILFDCKMLPDRKAASLGIEEIKYLHGSIKKILRKAIRMRGTSVSDYRDGNGKKGSFQKVLMVYKRNGQKCKICGTIVKKSVMSGRSTFYCPTCQK